MVGFLFWLQKMSNYKIKQGNQKEDFMEKIKTIKDYAKEAKKRLKSGFWQDYNKNLQEKVKKAELGGVPVSSVKAYYSSKVFEDIKNTSKEEEEFFLKVKNLLDDFGEVPDAIGRLTDKEAFNSMSYEERQRYTLSLSEKYVKAVERYKKEKSLGV